MSTTAATEVDAAVWFTVAGAKVKIPSINSFVYYFPQGHFESTSSKIHAIGRSYIPCRVLAVQFLCSNESNEVFAKISLKPEYGNNNHNTNVVENGNDDVVSSVKIVTYSDANKCFFTMPIVCADSIMPPFDSAANELVQNLTIKDTLNNAWKFRYTGLSMPRRHFLTTGWSQFVKDKDLNTGDSVVFMRKNSTNELFLGIRRVDVRSGGAAGVVEAAIESAGKGEVFEVDYYPRSGSPDFVVEVEKVRAALRVNWRVGMMVRVAVENEDLSSVTWLKGKVMAVLWPRSGPWFRSPWRILKVNCYITGDTYKVNPWEARLDEINQNLLKNDNETDNQTIPISEPVEDDSENNNVHSEETN